MKNKSVLHTKLWAVKAGKRLLAMLLVCSMIFSLCTCGEQKTTDGKEEIRPVTVEREPEPQVLQTANEAAAIALRQYIYARLATEAFLSVDASSMTIEELSEMADELLLAWKNAAVFSSSAENITKKAVLLLDTPATKETSDTGKLQILSHTFAEMITGFPIIAYAAETGRQLDPQAWAENITRQYDALRGAQRYHQLANQLGTDAKTAYEQMALAQKIIRNAAELEEAEGVVNAWTESINYLQGVKTASKVGVFVVGTMVTGGGSLSALGASGWSLGQAGGVIVGGTDCIVDIAATGSNIILGENNQVTVGFNDVKDKLAPVSAVVGLASFNSAETGEQLAYIGDTFADWFYEGKVMGVKVDDRSVTARIFDSVGTEALKSALESAGYVFPETSRTLVQIMDKLESNPETAFARMDALASQMAELEQAAATAGLSDPAGAESALPSAVTTPAGDINIFGRYNVVTIAEDGGTDSMTVTLTDQGSGSVRWTAEDEEEDEGNDFTNMSYDQSTHTLHYEEGTWIVHVTFANSAGTVKGSGYMSGILWEQSFHVDLDFTKISD